MGQQEIQKLVDKYPDKGFFTGDAAIIFKVGGGNIPGAVRKMEQQGILDVEKRKNSKGYWELYFKLKKPLKKGNNNI